VLPVVPRGEEDSDEVQSGEGSSGAWSAGSIDSCDGAEARLEVERAAGASGGIACFDLLRVMKRCKYQQMRQVMGRRTGPERRLRGAVPRRNRRRAVVKRRAPVINSDGLAAKSREGREKNGEEERGFL
jgi:hypothetical protein